jgi:hypothetical protein
MRQLIGQIALAFSLLCAGNAAAKQVYCHSGWGGGDHGYDHFEQVVISDKPIRSVRARSEADPGYETQKRAQSATLSFSTGWDNKKTYGNDAVLLYGRERDTKASFAKANYAFAKKCLAKELPPDLRKRLEKAALNPKLKRRK